MLFFFKLGAKKISFFLLTYSSEQKKIFENHLKEEVENYKLEKNEETFSKITFNQNSDEQSLDVRVFAYEELKKDNLYFRMDVHAELYLERGNKNS